MARRDPLHRALIELQVARLGESYADFRQSERYVHIARFFFEDVYSTEDKSERDEQFKRLHDTFRRRLGESITAGVGDLVALNDLSNELDLSVVAALRAMKVPAKGLTMELYEEAYRRADNYDQRRVQIEVLARAIRHFRALSRHFYIGMALAAVKAAARVFGGETVIHFLDRGYHAYKATSDEEIETFVRALEDRETARLDRIYGKDRPREASRPTAG